MNKSEANQNKTLIMIGVCALVILIILATVASLVLRSKTEDLPGPNFNQTKGTATKSNPDQTTSDVLSSGKYKAEVKVNPSVAPER